MVRDPAGNHFQYLSRRDDRRLFVRLVQQDGEDPDRRHKPDDATKILVRPDEPGPPVSTLSSPPLMPRRGTPDPLAQKIGLRVRALREAAGLTLEQLAYESELGSKGHLSDLEKGRVVPTVATLQALAERLHAELLDLVCFPDESDRHALVERTRTMAKSEIKRLLRSS